jgi:hypothetical protein
MLFGIRQLRLENQRRWRSPYQKAGAVELDHRNETAVAERQAFT